MLNQTDEIAYILFLRNKNNRLFTILKATKTLFVLVAYAEVGKKFLVPISARLCLVNTSTYVVCQE